MKKNILIFLLGGIVFASIAVVATTALTADQINYDENTTVKDKLDSLYTTQNQVIDNFTTVRETTGDKDSGYWSTSRCTGGTIPVTKNAYYIISLYFENSVSVTLTGANIIATTANYHHITTHGNVDAHYVNYYVYTTSDTLTVTSSQASYLSYTKMRLFQ